MWLWHVATTHLSDFVWTGPISACSRNGCSPKASGATTASCRGKFRWLPTICVCTDFAFLFWFHDFIWSGWSFKIKCLSISFLIIHEHVCFSQIDVIHSYLAATCRKDATKISTLGVLGCEVVKSMQGFCWRLSGLLRKMKNPRRSYSSFSISKMRWGSTYWFSMVLIWVIRFQVIWKDQTRKGASKG